MVRTSRNRKENHSPYFSWSLRLNRSRRKHSDNNPACNEASSIDHATLLLKVRCACAKALYTLVPVRDPRNKVAAREVVNREGRSGSKALVQTLTIPVRSRPSSGPASALTMSRRMDLRHSGPWIRVRGPNALPANCRTRAQDQPCTPVRYGADAVFMSWRQHRPDLFRPAFCMAQRSCPLPQGARAQSSALQRISPASPQ